jgi:hypothetical protein
MWKSFIEVVDRVHRSWSTGAWDLIKFGSLILTIGGSDLKKTKGYFHSNLGVVGILWTERVWKDLILGIDRQMDGMDSSADSGSVKGWAAPPWLWLTEKGSWALG